MPRMLCDVGNYVSEMSRAMCGCNLGCLHFVHGSVCMYTCVLDFCESVVCTSCRVCVCVSEIPG